jgi:hypothetical protein
MKLMKKMGYIYGQGLGRLGEGRVEPYSPRKSNMEDILSKI